jgi:hypothetical protein
VTDRLIYAALVAVWMAYLIPMGIRRYREVSAHGSIQSFSSSMTALGRTPRASETAPGGTPPGKAVAARPSKAQPSVSGVLDRPSAREAAARRRRTLFVLLGLVAVTGVLVVLTPLLWPAILVPIALVVAFLVVCRIQVARLEEAAWARAAAVEGSAAGTPAAAPVRFGGCDEETLVISGPAAARMATVLGDARTGASSAAVVRRPHATPARESVVAHGAHPAVPIESRPAVASGAHPAFPVESQPAVRIAHGAHPAPPPGRQPVAAVASPPGAEPHEPAASASAAASAASAEPVRVPVPGAHPAPTTAQPAAPATWDLRPVTLPTYITKSRAPRTVRSTERTGADSWSSGRNSGARPVRDEAGGKPVEQRRAVGS